MENLSQAEWTAAVENDEQAQILDVRTYEEYQSGIIPNAKNLDIMETEDFMNALQTLDKNGHYYLYCHSGGRSGQACQIMTEMGFENTYNLQGGILLWKGEITYPED